MQFLVLGATTSHSGAANRTIDTTNSWISQVLVLFVSGDACSQSTRWTKAVMTSRTSCQEISTRNSMLGTSHRGKSSSAGLAIIIRLEFLPALVKAMEAVEMC